MARGDPSRPVLAHRTLLDYVEAVGNPRVGTRASLLMVGGATRPPPKPAPRPLDIWSKMRESRFMNLTRLAVLGLLAERGPRHGHQLRRDTEVAEAERWGGVGAGSVHRELRQLEAEGLIEAVRREKVGRWPERTVFAITSEGRRELSVLRRQAVEDVDGPPDPLSVALVFAGVDAPSELAALLARRKEALLAKAAQLDEEKARGEAEGYLLASVSPLQAASFRRAEVRVAAELAWHEECELLLRLTIDRPRAKAADAIPEKTTQD